ncbi:ATP-binding cassette sub-family C member 5-like isoform X2 [Rhodnius prolixus]|uniref:ATP-binding cassette sub-family C member 5-like isoform X2 n=1 Tax=Rhodnius prolixus TaxID=13249 RepID=UPI003D189D9F
MAHIDKDDEDEENIESVNVPLWEDIYYEEDGNDCFDDNAEGKKDGLPIRPWDTQLQYIPGRGFSRYSAALKNLIPIRRKRIKENRLGVDEAGLWSFITLKWLSKFMQLAYRKGLKLEDIPNPSPYDACEYNVQRIETLWQEEVARKGTQSASLGYVTWRFMKTRIIVTSLLLCLHTVLGFLSIAFFMRHLIIYAESESSTFAEGFQWVMLLTVTELLKAVTYSVLWTLNYRTAIRLRSACLFMLYRKILRVNSLQNKTVGEIVNMFANDGLRVFELVLFVPMIVGGPVSMMLGISYVLWLLGPWPLFGISAMFLFYPMQYGLSRLVAYLKRIAFKSTDARITVTSELLNSIKFIKLYSWNKIFRNKIQDVRKKELIFIRRIGYCQSLSSSLAMTAPIISVILTLLIHIITSKNVTASQAFPLMALLSTQLRLAFIHIEYGLSNIIDLIITCSRFKTVLLLNETSTFLSRPLDKSQAVCIAKGYFAHFIDANAVKTSKENIKNGIKKKKESKLSREDKNEQLIKMSMQQTYQNTLFDINFYAPKGSLVGICGPVGSGKTSLLHGILGQIRMTEGKLCREGSCALVSQQPWLMNATLRENILFGEKFNARRYFAVLHCCALKEDIDLLPGADETEVGERGINLSGGQKQRVALARAVYSNRDIYLLDDPLSAVDPQVANHIFENCVRGALKNKTVLFVTHQTQYLRYCSDIVLMKEGRIIERGCHDDLMLKNGPYKIMIESCGKPSNLADNSKSQLTLESNSNEYIDKVPSDAEAAQLGKNLTTSEIIEQGSVKFATFLSYIRASGGVFIFSCTVFAMFLNVGSSAFSSWWLAHWIKTGMGDGITNEENVTKIMNETDITSITVTFVNKNNMSNHPDFLWYQLVYGITIVSIVVTAFIRGYVFTHVTLRAATNIHNYLLDKLLKTKMVFFERTPIGRLQNLFCKDMDEIDSRIRPSLETLIQGIWHVSFSLLFICLAFPLFIIPLVIIAFAFFIIYRTFRIGIRDLKRLDNTTRSPVFSNITCTINGLNTIHAFGKESAFLRKFISSFDLNSSCFYMCQAASRWLALRIDCLSVFIMFVTSLLILFTRGTVPPSLAGLAIAYAASLSGLFQFTLRMLVENEVRFLSVERVNSYMQILEQEGGHGPKGIPPDAWPETGTIRFRNVKLKYRPGLPLALNDVTFSIGPAEKIGVVGRTGAGKSSLITALFRLVDIIEGSIMIDGLDISTLNLEVLRSRMSIIPQDPVLLSGTIRSNLDPLGVHSDDEIWLALEKTRLKERISSEDLKLETVVHFNADNLSTGERQLLCLARALLRNAKVLILDEATSGLDVHTEKMVHNTVFKELKSTTTLIIAHRFQTISSCDRILVIDNAQVVEFDEPNILLENQDSFFYKLMSSKPSNS